MKNSRRTFIQKTLLGAGGTCFIGTGCHSTTRHNTGARVMTVAGPISADRMGITLPHEHVLVDFIGAERVSRSRYDSEEVFRTALPHLEKVHAMGCRTFIDCTPAYIGRDAQLLRHLALGSGLNILTNTGFYGAGRNKYLPALAMEETEDQLADRWIIEATKGISNTGIRPGFIKIGVDSGPLSTIHAKLVRAAARTHVETGLTIAAHTGDGIAALSEIRVVREEGLSGSSFVWVHAQNETDNDLHEQAAQQGAWVEFDGISPKTIDRHVSLVRTLRDRGHLNRILISHDAGWYHVGEAGGGTFRSFETLFTQFVPALRNVGFSEIEIETLITDNPRNAFSIGVRRR